MIAYFSSTADVNFDDGTSPLGSFSFGFDTASNEVVYMSGGTNDGNLPAAFYTKPGTLVSTFVDGNLTINAASVATDDGSASTIQFLIPEFNPLVALKANQAISPASFEQNGANVRHVASGSFWRLR
jgi:hypothetical protein